ncbi:MAG: aspartate/glutamate racemase family protein [Bacteroidia bacterium]|nr:aspartate/glutamate racemase family protein [Bacteroidales bacterium]MDY0285341.1 aspartate/glutamate racemase family protein [Bacteroidales bacterium]NCD41371.1 aspartate/glutamate racemase family protein [Bacteroidia bacterium]
MKIIGLIGGMSWESSLEYYRIINEQVKEKLGGLHSAKCLMYSVDFDEIATLQHHGNWQKATTLLINSAQTLEKGGADFIVICTNTMHKMADAVQNKINIPLLHIADATAEKIKAHGLKKIGLLGTKFTMEEDFYKGRLINKYGLDVITPDEKDRQIVHDVIYHELCLGQINPSSKVRFITIINALVAQGAEGVILGCTEIPLLVKQEEVKVILFDTTRIHAESVVAYSLQ